MSKSSDRAYETIKAQILRGDLPPGAQLREEELAVLCGVSRTPIRNAMHRLETEMFIQRTDSQRSFVVDWSVDDIEELFTLRTMLESHAAARAAEHATQAVVNALRVNIASTEAAIRSVPADVDAFLRLNAEFHRLVVEAAASDRLAGMINRLVLQPIVQRTAMRYSQPQLERSLAEHREIVHAVYARDPAWAEAVMIAHLRRASHVYREERWLEAP